MAYGKEEYVIPFVKYTPPSGHKSTHFVQVPQSVHTKATRIARAGYRFEMEILSTGAVSLTITDDEADWACKITNRFNIVWQTCQMIDEFDIADADARHDDGAEDENAAYNPYV